MLSHISWRHLGILKYRPLSSGSLHVKRISNINSSLRPQPCSFQVAIYKNTFNLNERLRQVLRRNFRKYLGEPKFNLKILEQRRTCSSFYLSLSLFFSFSFFLFFLIHLNLSFSSSLSLLCISHLNRFFISQFNSFPLSLSPLSFDEHQRTVCILHLIKNSFLDNVEKVFLLLSPFWRKSIKYGH